MRGINQVMIVGHLGADPDLRATSEGRPWCTLSVATHRNRREGEEWVEETDWHEVKVFGDDATRCQQWLGRGAVVAIEGTLAYEAWTDDHGQRRKSPRVYAKRVRFVTPARSQTEPSVAAPAA